MAKPEKEGTVKEIVQRFKDADAALFTEYRGLRVGEIADVRNSLREAEAEYKVLKNTLARLAVREIGLDELVALLSGPTAVAFVKGDVAAAAKALDEAVKKYPVLVVKGGTLEGRVLDAEGAKQLAKLESREVLLSKIAMLANSPAQQAVNVFAALLRDLGSMLAQVQAQKEEAAPGGSEETPESTPGGSESEIDPRRSRAEETPESIPGGSESEIDPRRSRAEETPASEGQVADEATEAAAAEGAEEPEETEAAEAETEGAQATEAEEAPAEESSEEVTSEEEQKEE